VTKNIESVVSLGELMRDNKKVVWVEFSTLWNHIPGGHWSLLALALIAIVKMLITLAQGCEFLDKTEDN
jgi:hypothetical protein